MVAFYFENVFALLKTQNQKAELVWNKYFQKQIEYHTYILHMNDVE